MQISSASLLAVQQARGQAAPQRAAAKPASADELFEPLFGKVEEKPATIVSNGSEDGRAPTFARPGSLLDIRI